MTATALPTKKAKQETRLSRVCIRSEWAFQTLCKGSARDARVCQFINYSIETHAKLPHKT